MPSYFNHFFSSLDSDVRDKIETSSRSNICNLACSAKDYVVRITSGSFKQEGCQLEFQGNHPV